jgi:hypothetical protein
LVSEEFEPGASTPPDEGASSTVGRPAGGDASVSGESNAAASVDPPAPVQPSTPTVSATDDGRSDVQGAVSLVFSFGEMPVSSSATGEDEDIDAMAPPKASIWGKLSPLSPVTGTAPPAWESEVAEWLRESRDRVVVIVGGEDALATRWVAEHLGSNSGCDDVRSCTSSELSNFEYETIFSVLDRASQSRCIVADYWTASLDARQLQSSIAHLGTSASHYVRINSSDRGIRKSQLIIWPRPGFLDPLVLDGKLPANLLYIPLPTVKNRASEASGDVCDEKLFLRVFGGDSVTLEEIASYDRELVERTLIRLLVLFGRIPAIELDEMMKAALGERRIHPAGVESTDGRSVPAIDLWKNGKMAFLRRAGAVRHMDSTEPAIGFPTLEISDHAGKAAWGDPEAMCEVFFSTRALSVLFEENSKERRRELFEGCIHAAVGIAGMAPREFSRTWLPALGREFQRVVGKELPGLEPREAALPEVLARIESALPDRGRRRELVRQFVRGVTDLVTYLIVDSPRIVEDLLEEFGKGKRYDIVWAITGRIRGYSTHERIRWARKILHESPAFAPRLTRLLVREASSNTGLARIICQEIAAWLPGTEGRRGVWVDEVSLRFPFLLLDEIYRNHEQDGSAGVEVAALFASDATAVPVEGATFDGYLRECCSRLCRTAADERSLDAVAHTIAAALFQLVLVTSAESRSESLSVALCVKEGIPRPVRERVTRKWNVFAELFLARKRGLPFNAANDGARRFADERVAICRSLVRL